MPGFFIVLEGPDGVGKSSQIKNLDKYLRDKGHETVITREPGGSKLAERIREQLLAGTFKESGPEIEALMFAAARSDHLRNVVIPNISSKIIICDRFNISTHVYQGMKGVDFDYLFALDDEAIGDCWPDLTILLDMEPAEIQKRQTSRNTKDRFENESGDYHQNVRDMYKKYISFMEEKNRSHNCVYVDASGTLDEVTERIAAEISKKYPL